MEMSFSSLWKWKQPPVASKRTIFWVYFGTTKKKETEVQIKVKLQALTSTYLKSLMRYLVKHFFSGKCGN